MGAVHRLLTLLSLGIALSARGAEIDDCVLRTFQRLLDTDDKIRPEARLPSRVRLYVSQDEAERGFRLTEALWRSGFERKEFRDFVARIADGHVPNADEAEKFRHVRAHIKQLRVAFSAFDARHEYPEQIDRLAAAMGHVQDALKNGAGKKARREALRLLGLLDKKSLARVEKEVRDFRPSTDLATQQWFRKELDELAGLSLRKELTPKQYHDMRKVVSRIVSVFDVQLAFRPDPEAQQVLEYLGSLNGEMGSRHDEIISDTLAGGLDYREGSVEVPRAIRRRLQRFIERATFN